MSDNTRSDFWSEDPFNGRSLSFDGTERFDTPPRDETSQPSAKRLEFLRGEGLLPRQGLLTLVVERARVACGWREGGKKMERSGREEGE